MPKIIVVGLGYVGLPSATVFASSGLEVVGVDVNREAVEIINSGRAHIIEPGLDDLIEKMVASGALRATTEPEPADVFVIAVPTPFKDGFKPDLKFVEAATRSIAPHLRKGNLVILESTSPVGTTEQLAGWIAQDRPDLAVPQGPDDACDIHLAYCPERILPGRVLQELVENDRVIGGITPECSAAAVSFYRHAVRGECHVTTARTAELCKLSENSFRDVNIAFANELSIIADKLDVDVFDLISLANRHPRVNILRPGTGVGGHCIAVDPWFIVDSAPQDARIIRTAREVNDHKPEWIAGEVGRRAKAIGAQSVACLGLAYKPDVDDLRESPSVDVVRLLSGSGLELKVCEPLADALPRELADLGHANVSLQEALASDLIVVLTGHFVFRGPVTEIAPERLFDCCGLLR